MDVMAFIAEEWLLVAGLIALVSLFIYRELNRGSPQLSVHELTRAVNNDGAVILDVRDSKEFKAGHIVDAINIPYTKVDDSLGKLE